MTSKINARSRRPDRQTERQKRNHKSTKEIRKRVVRKFQSAQLIRTFSNPEHRVIEAGVPRTWLVFDVEIYLRLVQEVVMDILLSCLARRALNLDLLLRLPGPAASRRRWLGGFDFWEDFGIHPDLLSSFELLLLGLVGFVVGAVVVGCEPVA